MRIVKAAVGTVLYAVVFCLLLVGAAVMRFVGMFKR
jgi:hypothetical protein